MSIAARLSVAREVLEDGNDARPGSPQSSQTSRLTYTNTSANPVSWYWVDFSCKEVFHNTIAPGADEVQYTYVGHIFRVRDFKSNVVTDLVATNPEPLPCLRTEGSPATFQAINNLKFILTLYWIRPDCTKFALADIPPGGSVSYTAPMNRSFDVKSGVSEVKGFAITEANQVVTLTAP